jgi:hypothetical protein
MLIFDVDELYQYTHSNQLQVRVLVILIVELFLLDKNKMKQQYKS